MPQYRFNGRIKAIKFADARVSVLLEDTTFLSNEGDWKQWTDWKLIESGKYKKGDVWVSAFEQSAPEVYQACHEIQKGSEVEVEIFKTEKGFLNINNISLKIPDRDVNEDLEPPDMPEEEPPKKKGFQTQLKEIEEEKSTTVDTREYRIVFQACLKGIGASQLAKTYDELIDMTERATQRTFKGK